MKLRTGYVVEYKKDPTKSGRVKIRLHGHQDDTQKVKDDDLPWAILMQPVTHAATHKIGPTPSGLKVGSRVIVGYLEHDTEELYPIVLGSIARGELDEA